MSKRADQFIRARDFKGAVAVFQEGWERGLRSPDAAYAAVRAAAEGRLADLGFDWLVRASHLGYHDLTHLELDSELEALRSDPRWPSAHEQLVNEANEALRGEGATNVPLSQELAAMEKEDQEARLAMIHTRSKDPTAVARVKEIDRQHLPRLRAIFAEHGWPGKHLVGKLGSKNAWVLVQHMDCDRAFQRQALDLMQPAVEAGEASRRNFAYLTDRVLYGERKPQRYGTQFGVVDGTWMPQELEDPAHVDARRKAMGLGTVGEAALHIEVTYGAPAVAVRRPGAVDPPSDDWCADSGG